MKPLLLTGLAALLGMAAWLCPAIATDHRPVADYCVSVGPIDVLGYPVVPLITECVPVL